MSSMLRSLRFVRRLNLGCAERRLGSVLQREVVPKAAAAARCLANANLDRNYVTRVAAVKSDFAENNDISQKLDDMDMRIKRFMNIYSQDVEEVLQMAEKDGKINSAQVLLLIRCCGEFLFNESVQTRRSLVDRIWKLLKELDVQLDVSHYNALLLVNLENQVDFSPLNILIEMKEKNIQPNRVTFQRLIEQYCTKGDIAGATKILEHMNQQDIPINENIFINLMKGHSNAGDTASALKLLDVMKEAGIEPSSQAYSALMCVHAKAGDLDSIMDVLNDCKEKDILISDKEILEVIYTLAINNYSQHVDKLLEKMTKGVIYNKEAVLIIQKLLDKGQDEVAYKLLKSLTKNKSDTETNSGQFFIRKLVANGSDAEKIIKYCRLMREEKLNTFALEIAIFAAYINKRYNLAFPLLKELKESGGEIREQYFYPILVNSSKSKNLQALYDSVKIITEDFNVNLSMTAIKDYIVSNLSNNYIDTAEKLHENGLSFIAIAHATVIHLLQTNELIKAYNFMKETNMMYRTQRLYPCLLEAFLKTKDVKPFVNILHYVYSKSYQENTNKTDNEEQSITENKEEFSNTANFISDMVVQAIYHFSKNNVKVVEKILEALLEKGININAEAAINIKQSLGEKLDSKVEEILSKLVSEKLDITPLKFENKNRRHQKMTFLQEKSKDSNEYKMVLIQEHIKLKNNAEVEKLLLELQQQNPTYTVGFCISLFDYYSKLDNIVEADNWYNRLEEIDPNCKIHKSKVISYARALIRNKRPLDALKVLEHPVILESNESEPLCARLIMDALNFCPEYVDEFFNTLKRHKYFVEYNTNVLKPLVKVHLMAGDLDKAINKFQWICETYNIAPMRRQIMKELIKREDAKALQHVTDLVTRTQDEMQALHDLAFAFFDCDRPRQARKILETPGLRLRMPYILNTAENFIAKEKLEDFVKLFKGLYIDMNPLYSLLLKSYEDNNESEKCLALWTQMQEENIQPTNTFMTDLAKILKKFNQDIPFTVEEKSLDIGKEIHTALAKNDLKEADKIMRKLPSEEKLPYLLQLIQVAARENNTTKAAEYMNELLNTTNKIEENYFNVFSTVLTQLAQKDDIETIIKLVTKIQSLYDRRRSKSADRTMKLIAVINKAYLESGQFSKLIDHLNSLLDQMKNSNFPHPLIITIMLDGLKQHPELEDRFKEYAIKAFNNNYYKPISTLWVHQFLHDSPEAEKTWNKYLSEASNIYPVSAVTACIENGAFEKIPVIIDKLQQSKTINLSAKQKMIRTILRLIVDSDCPQKYDIAFECLRYASKAVDIGNLNSKVIQQIQENVTNGQTIESLKTENERTKSEVTNT